MRMEKLLRRTHKTTIEKTIQHNIAKKNCDCMKFKVVVFFFEVRNLLKYKNF